MAKPLNTLADSQLKAATHPGKLFDGGGLYLHVQKNGARYWRMKYRHAGRERVLAIGSYPDVTLKQARQERDKARALISDGVDPVEKRREDERERQAAADNSFQALAEKWLENVHRHSVGASTYERNTSRLRRYAFPYIGRRPIGDLKPPEVLDILRRVQRQGHVDTAHRLKTLVSQVMRYAIAEGVGVERDITADLRGALAPIRQNHFAAQVKPDDVAPVLDAIENYRGTPEVKAALSLLPLLLLRPGNLRQLRWEQVDFERRQIELPITKNGDPLILPLAGRALDVLEGMRAISEHRSAYVFPNARSASRPISDNALSTALRNLGFTDQQTAHGFRATARTMLVERLGYPTELVEMQLGHRVADMHGRAYNRTQWLDERRAMMQGWADYLDTLRASG